MQEIQNTLWNSASQIPPGVQTRPLIALPHDNFQASRTNWPISTMELPVGSSLENVQAMGIIQRLSEAVHSLMGIVARLVGLQSTQANVAQQLEQVQQAAPLPLRQQESIAPNDSKPSIGEKVWNFLSKNDTVKKWGTKAINWAADRAPDWMKSVGSTVLDWGSKIWNFFQ